MKRRKFLAAVGGAIALPSIGLASSMAATPMLSAPIEGRTMSRWRDELTAMIAAMTDASWDHCASFIAAEQLSVFGHDAVRHVVAQVRTRSFEVPLGTFGTTPPVLFRDIRGRVNDRECCGAAAGTLLIDGFRTARMVTAAGTLPVEATMTVTLRDRPWNQVLGPDGWAEYRDATGNLPFSPADFGLLDLGCSDEGLAMSQARQRYDHYVAKRLEETAGKPEHAYWLAMSRTVQTPEDIERAFGTPSPEPEPVKVETWRDKPAQI